MTSRTQYFNQIFFVSILFVVANIWACESTDEDFDSFQEEYKK